MTDNDLFDKIVECAFKVRKTYCIGFAEAVYQNALMEELKMAGLKAEKEVPISVVHTNNVIVGDYRADILVEGRVILELKAIRSLTDDHQKQLVNYLKATGINDGFLINYGSPRIQIKHKYRVYKKTK